jgi:hypothetical protein
MPIIYRNEPAEATEAMKSGLEKMVSKRAFSTPRLRKAIIETAEAPVPAQAVPVYTLGLADLVKGKDVSAAANTGWRYAVKQNNEIVAHGETIIDPQGRHHFAATSEGLLVEGTTKALDLAEAQDIIRKGKYEVRFFQVPALYVAALWLVDKTGKSDMALPIAPTPPPLVPNRLIPFSDLLAFLQEKARAIPAAQLTDDTIGGS